MFKTWLLHVIAERLSARVLILQSMFSVGGVWPQLPSHFRNAICHTSGMQFVILQERNLKVSVYKKCAHLSKFVVSSTVAALAVSLSKNCDESEEERSRRLT